MTKAIWTCRAFLLGYFLVLHFTADTYTFLILNVGLAYIPFEIAVFLTKKPRVWWIFLATRDCLASIFPKCTVSFN